jgi:hypothetical protein
MTKCYVIQLKETSDVNFRYQYKICTMVIC